ncbi:MAG: winged helix-turn-helix domain-containing protein [Candidatus Aenigmarchaeota archaeon]|nr:winged helix-turn-helix domain-containing protein [Candidatus Aenigmarchaeota archaeon]
MNVEKIFGLNAGKVWKSLNKKGAMSATMLAKETKLKITEVHSALGWLGREGNISITKKKTGLTYSIY